MSFGVEILHAALAGGAVLLLLVVAELWRRWLHPDVETTRKFVHIGSGAVAASFPWWLNSPWTVFSLGVLFSLVLWWTMRRGLLLSVHGVSRETHGGIYYPIAICILFFLAHSQPVFYLISMLVLGLSDALAALLGRRYGRLTYSVEEDQRSFEGSTVFFVSTFLCAHIPLLLLTDIGRAECVLIAFQVAAVVTLFEAISLCGIDNLVVPLATYYVLIKLSDHSVEHLTHQIGAQLVALAIAAAIGRRYHFITVSGVFALSLFLYGAYSLGGPEWTVAPGIALIALVVYDGLVAPTSADIGASYQARPLFYTGIVAAFLYVLNNAFETLLDVPLWLSHGDPLYPLFVGAVVAQLTVTACAVRRTHPFARGISRGAFTALVTAAGTLLVLPFSFLAHAGGLAFGPMVVALAVAVLGPVFYLVLRTITRWPREVLWELRLQTFCVIGAALIVLPLQFQLHFGLF